MTTITRAEFRALVARTMTYLSEQRQKEYADWAAGVRRVTIGPRRPAPLAEALCAALGLKPARRVVRVLDDGASLELA